MEGQIVITDDFLQSSRLSEQTIFKNLVEGLTNGKIAFAYAQKKEGSSTIYKWATIGSLPHSYEVAKALKDDGWQLNGFELNRHFNLQS